jgi:hypothetical protein
MPYYRGIEKWSELGDQFVHAQLSRNAILERGQGDGGTASTGIAGTRGTQHQQKGRTPALKLGKDGPALVIQVLRHDTDWKNLYSG